MATPYKDLVDATNLAYDQEGDIQTYLNSLIEAVNGLDEDAWKGLSEESQKWFNDAVKEIEVASEGDGKATLNPPKGMPKAKAAKKESAPKKEKVKPAAKHVREILCEDSSLSLAQVMDKLTERGVEMKKSSAQVVYLNTSSAFEVAAEVGQVKKSGKVILTAAD